MVQLKVKNLGPIKSGSVSLAPLTVFIGPNNAGKSFLAMATYAATHARHFSGGPTLFRGPRGEAIRVQMDASYGFAFHAMDIGELQQQLVYFSDLLLSKDPLTKESMSGAAVEFVEKQLKTGLEHYALSFQQELERSFGAKLQELASKSSRESGACVEISSEANQWAVRLELATRKTAKVEVLALPEAWRVLEELRPRSSQILGRRTRSRMTDPWLLTHFMSAVMDQCFSDFPQDSYYLPAARSGILQSHKALASFVMSRASLVGLADLQIPRMTGVITDFISRLLEMERRPRGPFHDIARDLETDLLDGAVQIRLPQNAYPEISYRSQDGSFPLHRTSSMVSELAPVVLYLRNLLNRGELLIVEEPESHLHPQSQITFARAIARLVDRDLAITLTTHSDYFLTAINACIAQAELAGQSGQGLGDVAVLPASKVAAYLLERTTGGTVVKPLMVSPRDGIPEEEFASVAEAMYEETVAIDNKLMSTNVEGGEGTGGEKK